MDKIPFVDGTKIKNATVTVNEQEYEVTPAQYSGTTPVSAFNLNKMQNNIENTLVKVSATEPNPKADVWIKHKDVKNFEILSLQEDDILVNDNGVYNSVLLNLINPIKNRPYFTNSIYKNDGKIEINTNNGTYLVWIATSGGENDPSLLLIDVQNESITSNGFGGMHNAPTYSNGKITITTKNQYLFYGYIQLR